MRLAFLADAQSPNTASFLAPLVERGHEIHLISLHHAPHLPRGVKAHFLSRNPQLPKVLYLSRWPQVRRLLHRLRPDLVVAYRVTGNGLLAALAGQRPLVVVPTGTDVLGVGRRPRALQQIVQYVLRRADGILCWGPHMARAVVRLRGARRLVLSESPWRIDLPAAQAPAETSGNDIRPCKLLIQPRGIDRMRFVQRPYPPPEEAERITLVTTRALKASYNHETALRAIAHLRFLRPQPRLVLAGDGRDGPRLEELATALGITDLVVFSGAVGHEAIPGILAQGSFYISLIDHDGVSASLLEAMAVGLYPVVGDSEAARLWIRDGWNGSLIPGNDAERVADLIRGLTADREGRREVVKRNWRLVEERADQRRNSQRIEEWFAGVVADFRPASAGGRQTARGVP